MTSEKMRKRKQFLQLQNRYLTFKQQLNTCTPLPARNRPEEMNTSQPEVNVPTMPIPVQRPPTIIPATPMQAPSLEPAAKCLIYHDNLHSSTFLPPSFNLDTPSLSKITVINAFIAKEKKAADSFCKLLRR